MRNSRMNDTFHNWGESRLLLFFYCWHFYYEMNLRFLPTISPLHGNSCRQPSIIGLSKSSYFHFFPIWSRIHSKREKERRSKKGEFVFVLCCGVLRQAASSNYLLLYLAHKGGQWNLRELSNGTTFILIAFLRIWQVFSLSILFSFTAPLALET